MCCCHLQVKWKLNSITASAGVILKILKTVKEIVSSVNCNCCDNFAKTAFFRLSHPHCDNITQVLLQSE